MFFCVRDHHSNGSCCCIRWMRGGLERVARTAWGMEVGRCESIDPPIADRRLAVARRARVGVMVDRSNAQTPRQG
jgi:hypothetical protein